MADDIQIKVEVVDLMEEITGIEQLIDLADETDYDSFVLEVRAKEDKGDAEDPVDIKETMVAVPKKNDEQEQKDRRSKTIKKPSVHKTVRKSNPKGPAKNSKATDKNPNQCSHCKEEFTRIGLLKQHIMLLHSGEKLHKCSECSKKFAAKSNLIKHMVVHTGEKPHACSVCDKKFARSSDLNKHKLSHTGEKRFECSVCHKKFAQSGNLKHHISVHTDEKPFECTICNKKFTLAGSLRAHTLIHTGKKEHPCTECEKKFTDKSTLTRHMQTHTGEKPHKCSICNQKFARLSHLRRHLEVHLKSKCK